MILKNMESVNKLLSNCDLVALVVAIGIHKSGVLLFFSCLMVEGLNLILTLKPYVCIHMA